jgi:hypothetical protein
LAFNEIDVIQPNPSRLAFWPYQIQGTAPLSLSALSAASRERHLNGSRTDHVLVEVIPQPGRCILEAIQKRELEAILGDTGHNEG